MTSQVKAQQAPTGYTEKLSYPLTGGGTVENYIPGLHIWAYVEDKDNYGTQRVRWAVKGYDHIYSEVKFKKTIYLTCGNSITKSVTLFMLKPLEIRKWFNEFSLEDFIGEKECNTKSNKIKSVSITDFTCKISEQDPLMQSFISQKNKEVKRLAEEKIKHQEKEKVVEGKINEEKTKTNAVNNINLVKSQNDASDYIIKANNSTTDIQRAGNLSLAAINAQIVGNTEQIKSIENIKQQSQADILNNAINEISNDIPQLATAISNLINKKKLRKLEEKETLQKEKAYQEKTISQNENFANLLFFSLYDKKLIDKENNLADSLLVCLNNKKYLQFNRLIINKFRPKNLVNQANGEYKWINAPTFEDSTDRLFGQLPISAIVLKNTYPNSEEAFQLHYQLTLHENKKFESSDYIKFLTKNLDEKLKLKKNIAALLRYVQLSSMYSNPSENTPWQSDDFLPNSVDRVYERIPYNRQKSLTYLEEAKKLNFTSGQLESYPLSITIQYNFLKGINLKILGMVEKNPSEIITAITCYKNIMGVSNTEWDELYKEALKGNEEIFPDEKPVFLRLCKMIALIEIAQCCDELNKLNLTDENIQQIPAKYYNDLIMDETFIYR